MTHRPLHPTWGGGLAWTLMLTLAWMHLAFGEVPMSWPQWLGALAKDGEGGLMERVLWDIRIPRAMATMSGGILLGWLGMVMQTWFRNPLAGPGVLGITSGGSLGVALSVLAGWGLPLWMAASAGGMGVLLLIVVASRKFASPVTTLVFGLMVSYAVGALVTLLESTASAEALQAYIFWGMGTFGKASLWQANAMWLLTLFTAGWLLRRHLWLDSWLLGEDLATTMGVPPNKFQWELLLLAGLVVGWVTSVCGPLAFLGLATPHVYRFFHRSRAHKDMMWGVALWGGILALFADGVVRGSDAILMHHWPLNAVLAFLGAPIVLSVLWKRTHDWS